MLYGYLPAMLGGLLLTLELAAASLAIAIVFGLVGAVAKLSESPLARRLAGIYTTLIRGLPELVLMLLVFYGGQAILNEGAQALGFEYIDVPAFAAGALTIGFIFGAYFTETFRGAILAIPRGQIEAGLAFGLCRWQVLRRITLPQMIRHAVPGVANNWLVMVKATALVSIIGLDDMIHRANLASASTQRPFSFYAFIAMVYLALTTLSVLGLHFLERRYSLGVRRVEF